MIIITWICSSTGFTIHFKLFISIWPKTLLFQFTLTTFIMLFSVTTGSCFGEKALWPTQHHLLSTKWQTNTIWNLLVEHNGAFISWDQTLKLKGNKYWNQNPSGIQMKDNAGAAADFSYFKGGFVEWITFHTKGLNVLRQPLVGPRTEIVPITLSVEENIVKSIWK